MKVIDLDQRAEDATRLMKAMASPVRLKILCSLVEGEMAVGAMVERIGLREANVSQHLSLLRRDGVVATRRDGQTIYYRLSDPAALAVRETLYGIFCPPGPRRRGARR